MKILRNTWLALGLVCNVAMANADVIVLNFEGIADSAPVGDYYNGGGGPNYGISFSAETLALIDEDFGGTGNFSNEPSPHTIMFFLESDSAYLNYAAGFATGFSFFYSSLNNASVNVYSGLNATGNLLASINLDGQYDLGCTGDPDGAFCNFSAIGVSFDGIAKSIDFGGTANVTGFDDITFGSASPGGNGGGNGGGDGDGGNNGVPEPATLALFGTALAGMRAFHRYKAKP